MFKKMFIKGYQKRIERLSPKVSITLNADIPTPAAKEVVRISSIVSKVNSFESELSGKPDSFFKDKTLEFKNMLQDKIKGLNDEESVAVINNTLDEILPFYFAMVREAAKRTVRMRHFDVQILGGIVLHRNKIAEMATGEGKTLVATLAASLNALAGQGVHIVTVNDYLARRDWEWMGPIYRFLGLSCGVIQNDMDNIQRKLAYDCDITYGTNNEFGFDYLRDNMATSSDEMVQREHFYSIVDEVDSILIDEARTPLIISGPAEVSVDKYYKADRAARQISVKVVISVRDTKDGPMIIKNTDGSEVKMEREEFEGKYDAVVEEKNHNAYLTTKGEHHCEDLLGIKSVSEDTPDEFSDYWAHYITNALKAHYLFKKDKDYISKDGKVIIVDEFTGRLMPGRRWSDGIHQAIEAKEHLKIQQESQTLATITLQNYFRMYKKLAGMTGTAYTEANEFHHIYKLDVVPIPTNRPLARRSFPDRIYKTKKIKFEAIVSEIEELHNAKRPVLVGTASIDDSEELSFMLKRKAIPHNVLNAKYHEREAYIVAQAGRLGQVTIATNMAGRGTDIILGGNIDFFIRGLLSRDNISPEDERYDSEYKRLYDKYKSKFQQEHEKVVSLGGLHVIGAQRHEARRIDNQLKGRAGRQGDPGSSRFYISLEDDLMRLFGSERIFFIMDKFGFPDNEPIEHPWITHSIETAQKKVEAHNFDIRKELLKYDDVMNKQREVIYKQRREILDRESIKEEIYQMIDDVVDKHIPEYISQEYDLGGLARWVKLKFSVDIDLKEFEDVEIENIGSLIKDKLKEHYGLREKEYGSAQLRMVEKIIFLTTVDSHWKDHLLVMDTLKEGIGLRGYAQVDPLVAYQKESYLAFEEMIDSVKESVVETVFKAHILPAREVQTVFSKTPKNFVHSEFSSLQASGGKTGKNQSQPAVKKVKKVGRNDPCPCGSGKKYKKCCGRNL